MLNFGIRYIEFKLVARKNLEFFNRIGRLLPIVDLASNRQVTECGFNWLVQHTKLITMRWSVVHEIPKEDLLHRN
jgi:hypothetical protein